MKSEINLLPKNIQLKRVRRAYMAGFGSILRRLYLLLAGILLVEALVFWAVLTIHKGLVENTGGEKEISVSEKVAHVNQSLREFENRLDRATLWTLLVEDVLAIVPAEVSLVSVSASADTDALLIEGESATRSSVVEFQNKLDNLPWVIWIEAPLQNFALGPQTTFSFSLHRTEKTLKKDEDL